MGSPEVRPRAAVIAAFAGIAAAAAQVGTARADDGVCANRPGLDTPACIAPRGHVVIETALADWTLDRSAEGRSDTVVLADTLARVGLSDRVEVQFGWTPFGFNRVRDKGSRTVSTSEGVGDALLGAKLNFAHPDGSGFASAVEVQVTLPTGRVPIGAGGWSASMLFPLSADIGHGVTIEATPEVDAAADEAGSGRHLAWGMAGGLGIDLAPTVTLGVEAMAIRDEDPAGASTTELGGLSVAWRPRDAVQFDLGGAFGLNHATPDLELSAGVAIRL